MGAKDSPTDVTSSEVEAATPAAGVAALRRQLARERTRREAAESIGEQATSELFETVEKLRSMQAELLEVADRSRVVSEVTRDLRHALDATSLMERAARRIGLAVHADHVQVYVAVPEPEVRDWSMAAAPSASLIAADVYEAHLERLLFEGSTDRRGMAIRDVHRLPTGPCASSPLVTAAATGALRGVALVPMWVGAQPIGCLALFSVTPREWSDRDLAVCEELAADIGLSLMQLQAHEQQREVRRLEELDRAKDAFISNVSHELRTPLSSINGYVELIGEGELGPVPEPVARAIEVINRNALRLHRLVEDLLAFSGRDGAVAQGSTAGTDLVAVVTGCLRDLQPSLAARRLEVRVRPPLGAAIVPANPGHVERVVRILLSNAVKFTPDDGAITVEVTEEVDVVRLTVTDTGIGVPAPEQPHLFTRFFRSSLSKEREIQGTGLGLALAKALVERHGGAISIASIEGAGTTAVVTLPAAAG